MTQRNPMNERYTVDKPAGKTRKSAASAKVATKAGSSVHEAAGKSKKEKQKEQEERDRKIRARRGVVGTDIAESEFQQTPLYKRWRRIYWVCLAGAIVMTAFAWGWPALMGEEGISSVPLIIAWFFIILAFYVDLWKIRKLRNEYRYTVSTKSKVVRAAQKQHGAEWRERQKQEALNPTPKEPTITERIKGFFTPAKKTETTKSTKAAKADEADKEAK